MLDPNARALLLENLRPPEGGSLDFAIGTTFTLDLMALLTAPLAFTWFSWEDEEGRPSVDPNALLEAVRRHADHIHIFCQAGQIKVPANQQQLFAWLEPCVHEVVPGNPNGIFHPKVWVLRYRMPDGSHRIRLLCLSRNLTFDRSWDTMLVLDGEPQKKPLPENEPLVDFIRKLPALQLHAGDVELETAVNDLANDVAHTRFELPEGFDSMHFWPIGIGADNWPFPAQADRLLTVSPFLGPGHLQRLAGISTEQTLVSRSDELAGFSAKQLASFRCYAMTDNADLDRDEEAASDAATATTTESAVAEDKLSTSLSGLHAKLVVADIGDTAHVYTGSANATSAFKFNVEFVVELTGPADFCGVKPLLEPGSKGVVNFIDLLDEFTPSELVDTEPDDSQEQRLSQLQQAIVQARPSGMVEVIEHDQAESYALKLQWQSSPGIKLGKEEEITVWPINLGSGNAQVAQLSASQPLAAWSSVTFAALTSFFAFNIRVGKGAEQANTAFVMNLPLTGLPEDRNERVLASLFSDKDQVLRFLLLLLAGEGVISVAGEGMFSGPGLPTMSADGRFQANLPMLESLLQALHRDPSKLDQLARFIEQLRESEAGQALLPDEFDEIWAPLWEARQQLKGAEDG